MSKKLRIMGALGLAICAGWLVVMVWPPAENDSPGSGQNPDEPAKVQDSLPAIPPTTAQATSVSGGAGVASDVYRGIQQEAGRTAIMRSSADIAYEIFDAEAVDPDWADAYEKAIYTAFAEDELLSAETIAGVECKSERCLIQVYSGDGDTQRRVTQALREIMKRGDHGLKAASMVASQNSGEQAVTIFLGRYPTVNLMGPPRSQNPASVRPTSRP